MPRQSRKPSREQGPVPLFHGRVRLDFSVTDMTAPEQQLYGNAAVVR